MIAGSQRRLVRGVRHYPAKLCSHRQNIIKKESIIAVERAGVRLIPKPWGSPDLRPWSPRNIDGVAIGEIWFERTVAAAPDPALLLKLLFADQPLSIQVHPDDAFARSIGLPHGKTEAWYILSATGDAKVAMGLKHPATASRLRAAIEDGSIADLVLWCHVETGDVVFIPAGTIHAIGSGLVIAEIQQRSDATFRLFDFGRGRELHVDNAVAVSDAGPADTSITPKRLTDARTLLIACPYFILERIELLADSCWEIEAAAETWLLVLDGHASVGPISLDVGEAVFLEADRAAIEVGAGGLSCLAAYPGVEPKQDLLHAIGGRAAGSSVHPREARP